MTTRVVTTYRMEERSPGRPKHEIVTRDAVDRTEVLRAFDAFVRDDAAWNSLYQPHGGHRLVVLAAGPTPRHPENHDNPLDGEHYYRGWYHGLFFQRPINTGRPPGIVVWRVWHGGFREVAWWPWTAEGCAAAGAWAVKHRAVWKNNGTPIVSADEVIRAGMAGVTR